MNRFSDRTPPDSSAAKRLRILIPIAATMFALVAAELALRWGGFAGGAVELHARLLQHDPELGWAKVAGGEISYRWQGRRIVETANSMGARGPEVAADPAPGKERVLFLGDSFCEGYLVNDDEVFSAVLAGEAPVEAINHGVAGYSTDQQLLLYRRVAARYRPSRTVLLFFDNDVWFNAQVQEHRARKPMFEFSGAELRLKGGPAAEPDPRVIAAPAGGRVQALRLFRLLRNLGEQSVAEPGGQREPANELLLYRRDPPAEVESAWRLTASILERLDAEVRADGGELTVFYVPNVAAASDESWAATRALYRMSDARWDIRGVERRLALVCERLGVPLILPTSRLRAQIQAGRSLYFLSDGHWNADGHEVVATILSERLGLR